MQIIVGVGIVILICVVVGIVIWMTSRSPQPAPSEPNFPAAEDLESLLLFRPEFITAIDTEPQTATIYMDSLGNEVNNVRLVIHYDATLLANVSVAPVTDKGAFFGANTDIYVVEDNPSTGTLIVAIGSGEKTSARGNLVTLSFEPILDNFASDTTTIVLSEESRISGAAGHDLNAGYGTLTIELE